VGEGERWDRETWAIGIAAPPLLPSNARGSTGRKEKRGDLLLHQ